jgi:hypothetical protein
MKGREGGWGWGVNAGSFAANHVARRTHRGAEQPSQHLLPSLPS